MTDPAERGHADGCWVETWASIVHRCDLADEPVPGEVRTLARENPTAGLIHCAEGCPVLERARRRGRELAEEHGW